MTSFPGTLVGPSGRMGSRFTINFNHSIMDIPRIRKLIRILDIDFLEGRGKTHLEELPPHLQSRGYVHGPLEARKLKYICLVLIIINL